MTAEVLESDRLRLLPVSREQAAIILAGGVPPGLRFGPGYPGEFDTEVMDLLAGERAAEAPGFAPWFITLKATGEIIGHVGGSLDADGRTYTVGYDVVEAFQRRGYATEALQTLVAYLLSLPGAPVVQADTFPEHIASRRVTEKSGMTFVRAFRRVVDGEERDLVLYEIGRVVPSDSL